MENKKIEVPFKLFNDSKMPLSAISLRLNLGLLCTHEKVIDASNNLATKKLIALYDGGSSKVIDRYAKSMIRLLEPYVAGKLTIGFEIHNKAGELCRPHYHIHFHSNSPKETIRQQLRRYFLENDCTFKSKTDYSISSKDVEETNERKHFRYPLKMDYPILSYCHGFSDQQLQVLQMEAKAHLRNVRDHLSQKIEKKSSPTLCDELFSHLDSEYPRLPPDAVAGAAWWGRDVTNFRAIFLPVAIRWMDKNNKDFTAPSIVSKINRYLRLRQYITVEQYVNTIKNIM